MSGAFSFKTAVCGGDLLDCFKASFGMSVVTRASLQQPRIRYRTRLTSDQVTLKDRPGLPSLRSEFPSAVLNYHPRAIVC